MVEKVSKEGEMLLQEDQLQNYLCLICASICETPVQLKCEHMFCKGCLKKLVDVLSKEKDAKLQ